MTFGNKTAKINVKNLASLYNPCNGEMCHTHKSKTAKIIWLTPLWQFLCHHYSATHNVKEPLQLLEFIPDLLLWHRPTFVIIEYLTNEMIAHIDPTSQLTIIKYGMLWCHWIRDKWNKMQQWGITNLGYLQTLLRFFLNTSVQMT